MFVSFTRCLCWASISCLLHFHCSSFSRASLYGCFFTYSFLEFASLFGSALSQCKLLLFNCSLWFSAVLVSVQSRFYSVSRMPCTVGSSLVVGLQGSVVMKIIMAWYFIIICFYVVVSSRAVYWAKKVDQLPCFDASSLVCNNYLAK